MINTIIKNLIIFALLVIIILLIFGIFFYKSLPNNKIVPSKVEVVLSEQLQQELEATIEEEEQKEVIVTRTVTEKDLDKYENAEDYVPGKIDPFSEISSLDNTSTGGATGGSGNNETENTNK